MDNHFEVEIREQVGREPTLYGVIIPVLEACAVEGPPVHHFPDVQEGRAASGGRREVFAPGAIEWPSQGIGVLTEHRGAVETRGHVVRARYGRLTLTARATDAIQRAVDEGQRFMSIEFRALEERTTKGGVREILRAFVDSAALVNAPEYDMTAAEVRSQGDEDLARFWALGV